MPLTEAHVVLVVDDEEPVARVVSRFLTPHYQVLPYCITLEAAGETLASTAVGSIILDAIFPNGKTSLPKVRSWRKSYPETNIILRTGFPHLAPPMPTIADGAIGYLVKPGASMQEIIDAIESGRKGLIHFNQGAREYLSEWPSRRQYDVPLWDQQLTCIRLELRLTEKQATVALLKHARCTEPEIAKRLSITVSAVHARVGRLYEGLGIEDEIALVLLVDRALGRAGLIDQ